MPHRNYVDDVPDAVKQRRLTELIEVFRKSTDQCFASQIGTIQLVFVEGPNKRAYDTELIAKSDRGHRVSFTTLPVPERDDYDGMRFTIMHLMKMSPVQTETELLFTVLYSLLIVLVIFIWLCAFILV